VNCKAQTTNHQEISISFFTFPDAVTLLQVVLTTAKLEANQEDRLIQNARVGSYFLI